MTTEIHYIEGTIRRIHSDKTNPNYGNTYIVATLIDSTGSEINIQGPVLNRPTLGDYIIGNCTRYNDARYGLKYKAISNMTVELPRIPSAIVKRCKDIATQKDIIVTPSITRIMTEYAELSSNTFWANFQNHTPSSKMQLLTQSRLSCLQTAIKEYVMNRVFVPNTLEIERYFMELGLSWNSNTIETMLENAESPEFIIKELKSDPLCIIDLLEIDGKQIQEYFLALKHLKLIDDNTNTICELLLRCYNAEQNGDSCIPSSVHNSSILKTHDPDNKYLIEYNNCIYRTIVFNKETKIAEFIVKQVNADITEYEEDAEEDDEDEDKDDESDTVAKYDSILLTQLNNIRIKDRTPSKEQVNAVFNMLRYRISTVQGSAGTGKTTTLELLRDYVLINEPIMGNHILFLAPTGKAVDRICDSLGTECPFVLHNQIMTIHRYYYTIKEMIKARDDDDKSFHKCIVNPFLIVVDESSMISTDIMAMLVSSISNAYKKYPHIVFMGDGYQLPPINHGEPFMNMIQSGLIKNTTLSCVYRQGTESPLVTAITNIRDAIRPTVRVEGVFEISKVKTLDIERSMIRWLELHKDDISTMIIVPTGKKGLVGALTPIVRNYVNPASPISEIVLDEITLERFRFGDKMMQRTNNKQRGVYNGSVGIINGCEEITEEDGTSATYNLIVKVKDKDIPYTIKDITSEMDFAYVITTHKAQGSEYDHVLIIMDKNYPGFINRNLIYTAVSRGKKSVKIIITDNQIMESWRSEPRKRLTNLVHQIKELIVTDTL